MSAGTMMLTRRLSAWRTAAAATTSAPPARHLAAAAAAASSDHRLPLNMTKIVCTLGPSTESKSKVDELLQNGMSCARLNFSHVQDYSEPLAKLELVRDAQGKHFNSGWTGVPPNLRAVLVDTKGPEIRTGKLPGGKEVLEIGDGMEITLTHQDVGGDAPWGEHGAARLHVDYASLATTVRVGGSVLLDDGLIALEVLSVDPAGRNVVCRARNGGPIKANKGVNLPGATLDLPALTAKDKEDLRWAVSAGADYVAASFIRSAANVRSCVAFLERCCDEEAARHPEGPRPGRPLVISKIESEEGVENFREILEASDGIMVARGDLGVEIPFEKVFAAQKMMVRRCNAAGKPVIVATQMLDSMIRQPRPTRAEVTDVGAAVLDGADAVMLSGETAAGKYPIEAIRAMASILKEADDIVDDEEANSMAEVYYSRHESDPDFVSHNKGLGDVELNAVAEAAVKASTTLGAKLVMCITTTGDVARALARHRPDVPLIAFCFDAPVARRLQLHRAVHPVLLTTSDRASQDRLLLSSSDDEIGDGPSAAGGGDVSGGTAAADAESAVLRDRMGGAVRMGLLRTEAVRTAKEMGWVRPGDRVVCVDRNRSRHATGGSLDSIRIGTNMKVFTVV